MSFNQKWKIHVKKLETQMRVGCAPKEREPQRIFVGVTMECEYPLVPQTLEECVNYELVYQYVTQEWPILPHTILLETRIRELLEFIFRSDDRIMAAKVILEKPDIFPEMESVGIEAEWTRADFERLKLTK